MELSTKVNIQESRSKDSVERAFAFASLFDYGLWDRFLIKAADLAFFLLIAIVGRTVRWEVKGGENLDTVSQNGSLPILTIWHNRVFLSTYYFRKRHIVVMTSRSFDGEYIARFIQRFGFGAARGSS